MKKGNENKKNKTSFRRNAQPTDRKKKGQSDQLNPLCWIILPMIIAGLLILDALGIYIFNMQRLIVLGFGLMIVLLPSFNEFSIKDFSFKRSRKNDDESE